MVVQRLRRGDQIGIDYKLKIRAESRKYFEWEGQLLEENKEGS